MRTTVFRCLIVVLALGLAVGLSSCKTAGTNTGSSSGTQASPAQAAPAQPAPATPGDPTQELDRRMFVLKDGRDMLLTINRMVTQGASKEQLEAYARDMTLADLEGFVEQSSSAKRLVYVGNGVFRMDVLEFTLEPEHFAQAQLFLRLRDFEVSGRNISSAILDQVILDGHDFTEFASLKIYKGVLELMTRR